MRCNGVVGGVSGLSSRPEATPASAPRSSESAGLDWGVRVVPPGAMGVAMLAEDDVEEPDETDPCFAVVFNGSEDEEQDEEEDPAELTAFGLRRLGWYLYSGCSRLCLTRNLSASRWKGIFSSSLRILKDKKWNGWEFRSLIFAVTIHDLVQSSSRISLVALVAHLFSRFEIRGGEQRWPCSPSPSSSSHFRSFVSLAVSGAIFRRERTWSRRRENIITVFARVVRVFFPEGPEKNVDEERTILVFVKGVPKTKHFIPDLGTLKVERRGRTARSMTCLAWQIKHYDSAFICSFFGMGNFRATNVLSTLPLSDAFQVNEPNFWKWGLCAPGEISPTLLNNNCAWSNMIVPHIFPGAITIRQINSDKSWNGASVLGHHSISAVGGPFIHSFFIASSRNGVKECIREKGTINFYPLRQIYEPR